MKPGDRIGDWIVEGSLGKGGMGAVYACRNAMSDRLRAAVKVIAASRSDDRERFLREVEALDRVRHPFVVGVKGWGEDGDQLWIAMELVDGEDLQARLERGPLPEDEAIALFTGLASALEAAHAKGVTHRDVKPANIVLCDEGARLVDFGIARHDDQTRLTGEGLVAGTPAYMAPEAFTSKAPRPESLDIYALGQVFYEALTGDQAFASVPGLSSGHQIAQLVHQKNEAQALDPGETFSDPVRACIRAATAPSPTSRPDSMADVVALLDGQPPADGATFFVENATYEATPTPAPEPTVSVPEGPPQGPRPTTVGMAVMAIGVALVAILAPLVLLADPGVEATPPLEPAEDVPRLGKIKVEEVSVAGVLDNGPIGGVLRGSKRDFVHCYDQGLIADPELMGHIELALELTPEGSVVGTRVEAATLEAPGVVDCIARSIALLQFPPQPPDEPIRFILRFVRR